MNFKSLLLVPFVIFLSCNQKIDTTPQVALEIDQEVLTYITVLGIAQDAGYPQINRPSGFNAVNNGTRRREQVAALGLIDKEATKKYLFDATPDMPQQLFNMEHNHLKSNTIIDGIFLTHAHIGHYVGLMYLGREAMGSHNIPVYAMPRMQEFLKNNGPWSQLVNLENIAIQPIQADSTVTLTPAIQVTPFVVPHRDEYSETVGYHIQGPSKSALFIPDINKWTIWERNIVEEVKAVDYAFLDATFFADGEIPRPMSEIPHPFIEETAALFENEDASIKSKIVFIHFNNSNPAMDPIDPSRKKLEVQGFKFAQEGDLFSL